MLEWRHFKGLRLCGAFNLACILVLPKLSLWAVVSYSDPLQPSAIQSVSAVPKVPFYRIGDQLKQVEEEIALETQTLNTLAPLQPAKQLDAFGYHSDYIPAVEGMPDEPLWTLDLDVGIRNRRILGVVMVPTIDQRSSELKGYAFPKRFRISSVDRDGKRNEAYVDWTTQDFPDPGMRPVVFKFPSQSILNPATVLKKGLRIEVFAGKEDGGLEYFSLARVHLIRTDELHWPRRVSVSSSFESAPYWGADYLASPRHTLGMPLSAEDGTGGGLTLELPASKLEAPLVIRVDLDEADELGQVNVFPGQSADGIDVPGYGFPGTLQIYRLGLGEDTHRSRHLVGGLDLSNNPGNNMLRFSAFGQGISALEIECNNFPVYQGKAMFALGEIELFMRGRNLSRGRSISIQNVELDGTSDLSVLVDGKVRGRNILPLTEWIDQLAKGKLHEARLAALTGEQALLAERWQQLRSQTKFALWGLAFIAGLVFVLVLLRSRKQAQLRLRKQINSDLHDDVGSSLGSISLIAEQLQHADVDETVREDLYDLTLMAREAWASLREVVWVIDEKSIRLPMLIQKLTDRANRVLAGVDISIEVPEDCPDQVVSLTFKRHMIMYFKEVVHNCARHAQATTVCLEFRIIEQQLEVSVRDNGCGFDVTQASAGLGLESLHNRAQEMGGVLDLGSRVGEGTWVILRVPLKALLNETDHAYKTSN